MDFTFVAFDKGTLWQKVCALLFFWSAPFFIFTALNQQIFTDLVSFLSF